MIFIRTRVVCEVNGQKYDEGELVQVREGLARKLFEEKKAYPLVNNSIFDNQKGIERR